jgi:hypothetical protein
MHDLILRVRSSMTERWRTFYYDTPRLWIPRPAGHLAKDSEGRLIWWMTIPDICKHKGQHPESWGRPTRREAFGLVLASVEARTYYLPYGLRVGMSQKDWIEFAISEPARCGLLNLAALWGVIRGLGWAIRDWLGLVKARA